MKWRAHPATCCAIGGMDSAGPNSDRRPPSGRRRRRHRYPSEQLRGGISRTRPGQRSDWHGLDRPHCHRRRRHVRLVECCTWSPIAVTPSSSTHRCMRRSTRSSRTTAAVASKPRWAPMAGSTWTCGAHLRRRAPRHRTNRERRLPAVQSAQPHWRGPHRRRTARRRRPRTPVRRPVLSDEIHAPLVLSGEGSRRT